MSEQTFRVQDIHCGSCEQAIRKSLTRVSGVNNVKPDHRTNQITVAFDDSQVASDEIAARLADAGYAVVA
jgi:copper chaperone CopZ